MTVGMKCPKCAENFDCTQTCEGRGTIAHPCEACRYDDAMSAADKRFEPLARPLARLLETTPTVDQTGGMVMCLHVDLPRGFYAWFSEFDVAGFGIFYWDEATGDDGGGSRWVATDIPFDAEHGEEIAIWAAPLLMRIADEVTRGASLAALTIGEYLTL
jgi:hypothetical protein